MLELINNYDEEREATRHTLFARLNRVWRALKNEDRHRVSRVGKRMARDKRISKREEEWLTELLRETSEVLGEYE